MKLQLLPWLRVSFRVATPDVASAIADLAEAADRLIEVAAHHRSHGLAAETRQADLLAAAAIEQQRAEALHNEADRALRIHDKLSDLVA